MRTVSAFLFAFFLSILLPAFGEESKKKIALVIGNSDYHLVHWKLDNPVNDARLVGAALKSVGFQVQILENGTRSQINEAFKAHSNRLHDAGQEAVGLVFFAGHGIQKDGVNYIVPVDARMEVQADVPQQGVRVDELQKMLQYVGNNVNFIILDACRNNPLPTGRGIGGGLTTGSRTRGTLIAYSTAPDSVATDGDSKNSPFSKALGDLIPTPGITAESLFKRVGTHVEESTDFAQSPWIESSLRGEDFCFAGCDRDTMSEEQFNLSFALNANSANALRHFIKQYPNSKGRSLAEQSLVALESEEPDSQVEQAGLDEKPLPLAEPDILLNALTAHEDGKQIMDKAPKLLWYATFARTGVQPIEQFSEAIDPVQMAIDHRLRNGPESVTIFAGCDLREPDRAICEARAKFARDVVARLNDNALSEPIIFDRYEELDPMVKNIDVRTFNRFAAIVLHE